MMQWEKIRAYMVLTKWHWGEKGIPTIEQMKACVERLKKDCQKEGTSAETGGFVVNRFRDEMGNGIYEISFKICSEEQSVSK